MLELHVIPADVIGCYGQPAALDQFSDGSEVSVRVAPDELLLLGKRQQIAEIEAQLATADPTSVVIDLSCAFGVWALRGEQRLEAFRRLSAIPLPEEPAATQGLVAQIPAKLIVQPDELVIVVSAVVSHHLRRRLLAACADLAPSEYTVIALQEASV